MNVKSSETNSDVVPHDASWKCEIYYPAADDECPYDLASGEGDCWSDPNSTPADLIATLSKEDRLDLITHGGWLVFAYWPEEDFMPTDIKRIGIEKPSELIDRLLQHKREALKAAVEEQLQKDREYLDFQYFGDLLSIGRVHDDCARSDDKFHYMVERHEHFRRWVERPPFDEKVSWYTSYMS